MEADKKEILEKARGYLKDEGEAVLLQAQNIGENFVKAVDTILSRKGRLIITGVGKSGLIGRKIAATMASTGTPAEFVHPVEALHGDLGMISSNDTVLALSYSGGSEETNRILPLLRQQGLPVISITNQEDSRLARLSDIVLPLHLKKEACPLNIVPTSSTTATLAIGDALALSLMELKGFSRNCFAKFHPGGNLGKLLNLKVENIMHSGKENPLVPENATLEAALQAMSETKAGAVSVTGKDGRLAGFFTDGDLRRSMCRGLLTNGLKTKISEVMTRSPITVAPETGALQAAAVISSKHIDNLPVVDSKTGCPVGIVDEKDLLREGLL